ncbi:MAG: hypothetical protein M3Y41_16575, partial [Pseudomonadota bacterium]|nr:hypothetical protein [Pseudomonadota bacterium]
LSSPQLNDAGFAGLVDDTRQSLNGAIGAMGTEAGALGNLQTGLQTARTELGNTADALKSQLSSATDVDMAATLSKLTQTQTQLQASYQVIAAAKGLSLANYL